MSYGPAAPPSIRELVSLAEVKPEDWNALAGDHPLLSHAFLSALHRSGCAAAATGWAPHYLTLWRNEKLAGAMPLYLKTHSYGEYVFDWSWASAYRDHGLRYYPKFVGAIPFTPATGPRLLAREASERSLLLKSAIELAGERRASSLHVLFPNAAQAGEMQGLGLSLRHGLQFVWSNAEYRDFADFLDGMSHDKRKKIKQDRRKIQEGGIVFERLDGNTATQQHWEFFYKCYANTYRMHRSTPYLSLDFFRQIAGSMPSMLLLIVGYRDGQPLCAALNIHNAHTLYGRYWGSEEYFPGLHFETCYYQALEFCISRGIQRFEGGAQGEHKHARGFLPVPTYSAHWLADARFAHAVRDFNALEGREIEHLMDEFKESSPFKVRSD